MKLKGKVALITGAARGIGRGIAEIFAEEGADVVIKDIDTSGDAAKSIVECIKGQGRRSIAVQGDASKRSDVEAMVAKAWDELGPIDILVNNAGIETIVPFLEISDEQWSRVTDVDLRGPWLCSQVFCRRVTAEKRKANIVTVGAIQAAKILPGRPHCAPAKLAIEALTRITSAEISPSGIRG